MKKIFSLVLAFAAATTMAFGASQQVNCGTTVKIKATPKTHCYFVKWSDENTDAERTVTVDQAMTLTAIFAAENTYQLTLNTNDTDLGSVIITEGEKAAYYAGDHVTIKAVPGDDCRQFLYWADDQNNKNPIRTIEISATAAANVYTAIFEIIEYQFTIEANDDNMGTVEFVQ